MTLILDMNPMAKPRMTHADKWKKRFVVLRYRAFCDEIRLRLPRDFDFNNCAITFVVPMPKSWSKKKKDLMNNQPHTQTPDLDNFLKALFDAHMSDDSGIHTLDRVRKVWGLTGQIRLSQNIGKSFL